MSSWLYSVCYVERQFSVAKKANSIHWCYCAPYIYCSFCGNKLEALLLELFAYNLIIGKLPQSRRKVTAEAISQSKLQNLQKYPNRLNFMILKFSSPKSLQDKQINLSRLVDKGKGREENQCLGTMYEEFRGIMGKHKC